MNKKMVNRIHLKYVDDLSLAEFINLPAKLLSVPDSVRPSLMYIEPGQDMYSPVIGQ